MFTLSILAILGFLRGKSRQKASPTYVATAVAPLPSTVGASAPVSTPAAVTAHVATTPIVTPPAPVPPQVEPKFAVPTAPIPSPFKKISDEDWTKFVVEMRTAAVDAVSESNALGMFELKPRRLADLGLVEQVSCTRGPTGRMVWVGNFRKPLTSAKFLRDPAMQYRAFRASMKKYCKAIAEGKIERPEDDDVTLSGALAILHCCGPSGLKTWDDEEDRFPNTQVVFDRANGIF